jgi:hypothetical protein
MSQDGGGDDMSHGLIITITLGMMTIVSGVTWTFQWLLFTLINDIRADHVRRAEFEELRAEVVRVRERQAVVLDRLDQREKESDRP